MASRRKVRLPEPVPPDATPLLGWGDAGGGKSRPVVVLQHRDGAFLIWPGSTQETGRPGLFLDPRQGAARSHGLGPPGTWFYDLSLRWTPSAELVLSQQAPLNALLRILLTRRIADMDLSPPPR